MGKFKNLVFGGGGLRCMAYIGVLRALEEYGVIPAIESYAGASAGAIFATMISIGYTHAELKDFIRNFEYEYVKDIQLLGITENFGLETGNKIERFLQLMIRRKTGKMELTFAEHYEITRKKLYINAVCLDDCSSCYFNVDTHPTMPVYLALRMSIALPILISPVRWEGKLYVDGGLLDNLPVSLFDGEHEHDKTLVLRVERPPKGDEKIDRFESFCFRTFSCIFDELVRLKHKDMKLEKYNVISISTDGHNAFSFNLDKHDRKKLYRSGYATASAWLKKDETVIGLVQSIVKETKDAEVEAETLSQAQTPGKKKE